MCAPLTQLQFDPTIVPVTGPTLLATLVPVPSLRPKRPSRPLAARISRFVPLRICAGVRA